MKGRYKVLITFVVIIGGFYGWLYWPDDTTDEEIADRYEGLTVKERENLYYEKYPEQKLSEDIEVWGGEKKSPTVLKTKIYESQEKFDPTLVKTAKENIPKMQSFFKTILKQCKDVKSFYEYETFLLVMEIMEEEIIEATEGTDSALTSLELLGYDKHPEVGTLISETRSLGLKISMCMDGLFSKYG